MCGTRAGAWAIVLANWRSQGLLLLRKAAKVSGVSPIAKLAARSQLGIFGSALLVVALSTTAGGVAFLSDKRADSSRGAPSVWLFDRSSSPADAAEPGTPATLITPTEAVRSTPPGDAQKPARTAATEPSKVEQSCRRADAEPAVTEQAGPHRRGHSFEARRPRVRKGVQSDDLAALQSFYAERNGSPRLDDWHGLHGQSPGRHRRDQEADEWGLSADAFDLPPAGDLPATAEAQAPTRSNLGLPF